MQKVFAFNNEDGKENTGRKPKTITFPHGCILFANCMTKWQAKCQIQDEKLNFYKGKMPGS